MAKIIIGTDMDNSGFEKKLKKLKDKIEHEELKLNVKSNDLEDANQDLREANLALEERLKKQREINKEVVKYQQQYNTLNDKIKRGEALTGEEYLRHGHLSNMLKDLTDEQAIVNKEVDKYNEKVNKATDKVVKAENSLKEQEKAVVNVRQEYAELVNEIEQNKLDEATVRMNQIKNEINSIGKQMTGMIKKVARWALAVFGVRSTYFFVRNAINTIAQEDQQLKNDLDTIRIGLAYTIEPLVRKIVEWAKLLFQYIGFIVKMWTNGKIDIFARAQEHMEGANKAAKELQKTSASFDKFNKLNASSSSSAGAGAGISAIKELEDYPGFIKWIAENKKAVEALGIALLAVFGMSNIVKIVSNIAYLITGGLTPLSTLLLAIAAPVVIYFAAKGLSELINEVKELNKQIDDMTEITKHSKEQNEKLNDSFWDLYEQGKLNEQQIQSYINNLSSRIELDSIWLEGLKGQKNWLGEITGANKKVDEQMKNVNATMLNTIDSYTKLYEQGLLNEQQQKDYKTSLELAMQALSSQGQSVTDLQIKYQNLTGKKYTLNFEAKMDTKQAEKDYSNFMTRLGQKISSGLGKIFDFVFPSVNGGGSWAHGAVYYPNMPKLAAGGIVNMPGRGVPYHGGIIGERGAEGVIPLTDTAQMELLGKTIGKFVSINADITLELESRILAKVMKEITNNNNFMRNGG